MRQEPELSRILDEICGFPYQGVLTRYVDSDAFEAGGKDCFYDLGPRDYGQRYSPKGGARGIYLAEGIRAAIGEATQRGLSALSPDRIATRQQMDIEVHLNSVLDLGNEKIRRRLNTSLKELKLPWKGGLIPPYTWPATWLLGKAVFESQRFDAIRYPSKAVNLCYCMLILTERMGDGAKLIAHRPGHGKVIYKSAFNLKP